MWEPSCVPRKKRMKGQQGQKQRDYCVKPIIRNPSKTVALVKVAASEMVRYGQILDIF